MRKFLKDYIEVIKKLPIKSKYSKEELLINDFLIQKEGKVEIYYAPHNEYINPKAKVFIVGITPGFQQMNAAIVEARKGIENGLSIDEISYNCKVAARFSGSLRNNIISMLDGIYLNNALEINSCSELFKDKDYLLHTISLIPYSVFVDGNNYTGHTPKILKTPILMKYIENIFLDELSNLENVLIIPLGKAVEEVLDKFIKEGRIDEEYVLKGFPHPSGANGNRKKQYEDNKEKMIEHIKEIF